MLRPPAATPIRATKVRRAGRGDIALC